MRFGRRGGVHRGRLDRRTSANLDRVSDEGRRSHRLTMTGRKRRLRTLAQGKLRAKFPALREALQGRFEAHHALVIGAILAHLDSLDEQIARAL